MSLFCVACRVSSATSLPAALRMTVVLLVAVSTASLALAQTAAPEIHLNVTYVCNGERIYIDGCNIRDLSDNGICDVAHPDKLTPTGIETYTYVNRGALKKLLPTCTQPSAKQLAAADAFEKKQQDIYNANVQKANQQMQAAAQPGQPNPLAGRPYVLLRSSYADTLAQGGVSVPPGVSPYKYVGTACGARTLDCQKSLGAIKASAASAVRADGNGSGTFPGVPPGTTT